MNPRRLFLALLIATAAWAGQRVYGTGGTRAEACRDAETRGRQVALEQGTCTRTCDPRQCTQESDGSWSCFVDIPNHRGSCP